jgi:outer membrane protein
MLTRLAMAFFVAVLAPIVFAPVAIGQTLDEAMSAAYENNPTLNSERARLRGTDEQVPQALSGYRPTVSAFSEVGRRWLDSNRDSLVGKEDNALFTRTYGASIEQPVFRGGQTIAAVRGAENTVHADRARLESVEQSTLLDTATAYANVYRDQAVLELTIRNEQRLARQLEAARDRFRVGEVTRTDVSQAEARVARATAERVGAEGDLAASRAEFRTVVGLAPSALARPPLPQELPTKLDDATALAVDWYPDVTSASFRERSALDSVDQVRGEWMPSVSLIGRVERDMDNARRDARVDSAAALVNVTVPLYQSGAVYSRLRASKQQVAQQRQLLEQAQRDAVERATRSWNALETAVAEIGSFTKQVEANQVALEGVEREAEVGARTVLDVLDAQQELLDSQVSLARAERDEIVAAFQLKSSVGQLTARQMSLPVDYYDPQIHYREVRDEWFGGSSRGDVSSDFDAQSTGQ